MTRSLLLPNGSLLEPGRRVRLLRSQVFEIPQDIADKLGLVLIDDAWSYDTEVIYWPP